MAKAEPKPPEDMTDDELEQFLSGKPPEEEPKKPEKPAPKEEPETPKEGEEEEPEEEPEEPEETEEEEPEEPKDPKEKPEPSRREQLRINQLLEKLKTGQPAPPEPKTPDKALSYKDELDTDEDTLTRLQKDREDYGRSLYEQGRKEASSLMFRTRLEIDAPRVESKYPFLDPHSDKFDPNKASALNSKYLQFVGFDRTNNTVQHPDIRYSDFVEAEIEFAKSFLDDEVQQATRRVKSQAGKTGLRPGGSSGPKLNLNKAPEDMTDDELDAYLAQALPKR